MSLLAEPTAVRKGSARLRWFWLAVLVGIALGLAVPIAPPEFLGGLMGLLVAVVIVIFWVMPAPRTVPSHLAWFFLAAAVASSCVLPAFIALQLPGLPWITVLRLLLPPAILLWLYCHFNSQPLRQVMRESAVSSAWFFFFLGGYVLSMLVSIAFSPNVSVSVSGFVNHQLSRTFVLLAAISLMGNADRVAQSAKLIVFCAIFDVAMGIVEFGLERNLWLTYLPSFLIPQAEFISRMILGAYREGIYRISGSFSVSLSLAEFLALTVPFIMYWFIESRQMLIRAFYAVMYVLVLVTIYLTGSRLGMVGFFLGTFCFVALHTVRQWIKSHSSLTGPLLVAAFPLLLAAYAAALMTSGRLYVATFGGGEAVYSDEGRTIQWQMAIEKFKSRPVFGYGVDSSGDVLGYLSPAGVNTIDNYVIVLMLEVGFVGLVMVFGLVCWTIFAGIRLYLLGKLPSSKLAGPFAISLFVYVVIRWVLAQPENQMLVYMMLGAVVALNRLESLAQRTEVSATGADRARERATMRSRVQPSSGTAAGVKSNR